MTLFGQDSWHPTFLKKFIESFETSTGPSRIETDAGEAIIKALGNNQGPHALARELIAIRLANWFNLPIFEYAVMELQKDDVIPLGKQKRAEPGPAFVTKYHVGQKWDGTEEGLKLVENCQIITKLVVFDNWILNVDRYPPDPGTRKANFGNVFLSEVGASKGKFRIIVMDHSHCLRVRNTEDLSKSIANIDYIKEERPYGVFPAFVTQLKKSFLDSALSQLGGFTESDADQVLFEIPLEWKVTSEVRVALKKFLVQRADFLVQRLPIILSKYNLEQGDLGV